MADNDIIIKKIKKGGHSAHGGAWKVAYADFVTAMMAFFLLLWLLNATPAENLAGLSDFFSPTQGLKDKMGIGFSGGVGPAEVEGQSLNVSSGAGKGIIFGAPPSGALIKIKEKTEQETEEIDYQKFTSITDEIMKTIEEDKGMQELRDSIMIEQTPEGLRIQLVDQYHRSMFKKGTVEMEPYTKRILTIIANIIRYIPNYVSISGHTIRDKTSKKGKDYTNWELSSDRANVARRFLVAGGMNKYQIARIVGRADHEPIDLENPDSPRNNRLTILLLKDSIIPLHKQSAPEELHVTPEKEDVSEYLNIRKGEDNNYKPKIKEYPYDPPEIEEQNTSEDKKSDVFKEAPALEF